MADFYLVSKNRSISSSATATIAIVHLLLSSNVFWTSNAFVTTTKTNNNSRRASLSPSTPLFASSSENGAVTQASFMSTTTSVQVDMNDYNLPLDMISEQWTAQLVAQTDFLDEGVYLGAKNTREFFADSVKLEFPRLPDTGLGLDLLELAGGREDGLGITVVQDLIEGGCAENSGIMIGDSIVKVAVRKTSRVSDDSLEDFEETLSVGTECYGFDRTVEAIVSLPPCESNTETFIVTVKRLRRKPKVKVLFQYPPEQGLEDVSLELFSGENLRRAMLARGIKLNDPLSRRFDSGGQGDCGAEGTCATCAVNVVKGGDLLSPASVQESQMLKKNPRWRMACKAIVGYGMKEGELQVRVNPRQW